MVELHLIAEGGYLLLFMSACVCGIDVALLCAVVSSYANCDDATSICSCVPRALGLSTASLSKLRFVALVADLLGAVLGSECLLVGSAMRDCKVIISAVLGSSASKSELYSKAELKAWEKHHATIALCESFSGDVVGCNMEDGKDEVRGKLTMRSVAEFRFAFLSALFWSSMSSSARSRNRSPVPLSDMRFSGVSSFLSPSDFMREAAIGRCGVG